MKKILALGALDFAIFAAAAMLAAGGIALAYKMPKPAAAQHHAVPAVPARPVDPAILHGALQKLRSEGALP